MGCPIKTLSIPNSVTNISSRYYYSMGDKYDGAFENCNKLTNIIIGDRIETIERETFRGCTSLTTVSFGERLALIDNDAFNGCNSVIDVYCYGTEEEGAGITVYSGNDSILNATIHYR